MCSPYSTKFAKRALNLAFWCTLCQLLEQHHTPGTLRDGMEVSIADSRSHKPNHGIAFSYRLVGEWLEGGFMVELGADCLVALINTHTHTNTVTHKHTILVNEVLFECPRVANFIHSPFIFQSNLMSLSVQCHTLTNHKYILSFLSSAPDFMTSPRMWLLLLLIPHHCTFRTSANHPPNHPPHPSLAIGSVAQVKSSVCWRNTARTRNWCDALANTTTRSSIRCSCAITKRWASRREKWAPLRYEIVYENEILSIRYVSLSSSIRPSQTPPKTYTNQNIHKHIMHRENQINSTPTHTY